MEKPCDRQNIGLFRAVGGRHVAVGKAGTKQYPPAELLEYAIASEDAGFDSIDARDHFLFWAEKGEACFVWSWLGAVVGANKTRMGPTERPEAPVVPIRPKEQKIK
jgi:hypothetical protein